MDELHEIRAHLSPVDPPTPAVVRRQREQLMDLTEDTTTPDTTGTTRRRRRRVVALVAAPLAAVGLAAAGWVALQEDATEAAAFACIADGVTAVLPNDGTSPVDACADVWASGGMIAGVDVVPALAACTDRGAVVVIEATGDEPCRAVGLSAWADQPAYEALGAAVREVRIGLHDRFAATGNGCATVADWQSGLAEQPGAAGVRVDAGSADDEDCVDIASIDPTTSTIALFAYSGGYSIGCDPRTGC